MSQNPLVNIPEIGLKLVYISGAKFIKESQKKLKQKVIIKKINRGKHDSK
jgi:hypothetical protein